LLTPLAMLAPAAAARASASRGKVCERAGEQDRFCRPGGRRRRFGAFVVFGLAEVDAQVFHRLQQFDVVLVVEKIVHVAGQHGAYVFDLFVALQVPVFQIEHVLQLGGEQFGGFLAEVVYAQAVQQAVNGVAVWPFR
jgi:hypothetical protein